MELIPIIRDLGLIPAILVCLLWILWRLGNRLTDGHLHFLTEMERRAKFDQEILQTIQTELVVHSRAHENILARLEKSSDK